MEMNQLYYFRTVAESGSFTRAADSLHMTQSALSKSIAKLEAEIGIRLFERDGNHISLNRFGQRFLQDSEQVIGQLSDCVRAMREMSGLEQGEIRIAISKDVFIDHVIHQFLTDNPDVSFHCYLLSPAQMLDALGKGAIDFVVTTRKPIAENILWRGLYCDQLEVLLSQNHPLATRDSIRISELKDERFIVTNSNYSTENIIQNLCLSAGFTPKILYEGTSTDMPMSFISDGVAVMVTPHSITLGVREMMPERPDIACIPLVNELPDMRKTLGIAYKQGHYQSQAAQDFFDRLVSFYAAID